MTWDEHGMIAGMQDAIAALCAGNRIHARTQLEKANATWLKILERDGFGEAVEAAK